MFESLFGAEIPLPVRFFIAFLIVLALIGVFEFAGLIALFRVTL